LIVTQHIFDPVPTLALKVAKPFSTFEEFSVDIPLAKNGFFP
jgi:hypothetical protein